MKNVISFIYEQEVYFVYIALWNELHLRLVKTRVEFINKIV